MEAINKNRNIKIALLEAFIIQVESCYRLSPPKMCVNPRVRIRFRVRIRIYTLFGGVFKDELIMRGTILDMIHQITVRLTLRYTKIKKSSSCTTKTFFNHYMYKLQTCFRASFSSALFSISSGIWLATCRTAVPYNKAWILLIQHSKRSTYSWYLCISKKLHLLIQLAKHTWTCRNGFSLNISNSYKTFSPIVGRYLDWQTFYGKIFFFLLLFFLHTRLTSYSDIKMPSFEVIIHHTGQKICYEICGYNH